MSVARLFPFLKWFPVTRDTLRADAVAGITVALVLVPQSMAYAQLAGLPVVYGLYASFVPVIVAALWGSLNQLHTGPVAMLSLMSAAALVPLASPGSPDFVELSIMLAFAVGVLRLLLGIFRLGVIVNFLSQPVVVGFTNAAALIIGLSQLSKLLGVPMPRTESFLADLWTVMGQAATTHWPTLAFALGALALILFLKRVAPNAPGILIAVVTATVVSWAVGFERTASVPLSGIEDARFRELLSEYQTVQEARKRAEQELASLASQVRGPEDAARQQAEQRMQTLRERQNELKRRADELRIALHARALTRVEIADGGVRFVSAQRPLDPGRELSQGWRFVRVEGESVVLSGGGAVVGEIPAGLPTPSVPELRWDVLLGLLPEALVMALIGFMEATSISKAIASRTRQRIDTSQELIGQDVDPCHDYVRSKAFDHLLADELIRLPDPVVGRNATANDRSLAFRNLLRGYVLGLPSGQAVARALVDKGYPDPVDPGQNLRFDEIEGWRCLDKALRDRLEKHTPLFLYLMREAGVQGKGRHLGPVGSAIVLEVFGAMLLHCNSFLTKKGWKPDPCIAGKGGELTLADLVRYVEA